MLTACCLSWRWMVVLCARMEYSRRFRHEGCLNTFHQYHLPTLPMTCIRVTSEEMTSSASFMHIHACISQWRQTKWVLVPVNLNGTRTYRIISLHCQMSYNWTSYLHKGWPQTDSIISFYINLFVITWWKLWHMLLKKTFSPGFTFIVKSCHCCYHTLKRFICFLLYIYTCGSLWSGHVPFNVAEIACKI